MNWQKIWKLWAILGIFEFVFVCFWQPFSGLAAESFIGYILVFAPLVIIPLAMSVIRDNCFEKIYVVCCIFHPIAAGSVVLSLTVENTTVAVALASVWLLQNLLFFCCGLLRLKHIGYQKLEELCITCGLLYIPIAGSWWIIHILGYTFGFKPEIVILTAVHFHYAGFAAPIITGLTGRWLQKQQQLDKVFQVGGYFVAFGPFFVALGITFSPLIEVVSANILALGVLSICFLLVLRVSPSVTILSRFCFHLAAFSLMVTMVLAGYYAISEYWQLDLISIPTMAKTHGMANAFGFAFCGLLGWNIENTVTT